MATLAVLAACSDEGAKSVRGVITDVQADSLIEWRSLTLRDDNGKTYTFTRSETVDLRYWRASHLREHMVASLPVTVVYRHNSQGLVAIAIRD